MGPGWRRSQLPPPPACLRSQLPPGLPAPPPPPPCRRSQLPLNVCRRSQLPDARAPARWRSRLPPPPPPVRASAPAPPPHPIRQSRLQMVWRRSVVPTRRFSGATPGGPGSRPAPPGLASTPAGTGSTPRPRRGRGAVSRRWGYQPPPEASCGTSRLSPGVSPRLAAPPASGPMPGFRDLRPDPPPHSVLTIPPRPRLQPWFWLSTLFLPAPPYLGAPAVCGWWSGCPLPLNRVPLNSASDLRPSSSFGVI